MSMSSQGGDLGSSEEPRGVHPYSPFDIVPKSAKHAETATSDSSALRAWVPSPSPAPGRRLRHPCFPDKPGAEAKKSEPTKAP